MQDDLVVHHHFFAVSVTEYQPIFRLCLRVSDTPWRLFSAVSITQSILEPATPKVGIYCMC